MSKLYVAYGSNLNLAQMFRRCPDATVIGTSEIDGYELLFKGNKTGAHLTIEKKTGGKVPVGVFEVSDQDEFNLDMYEGYPIYYRKENFILPVKDNDGNVARRQVFVYIMDERNPLGIPSNYYMDTCLRGYDDFGFNPQYLMDAYDRSANEIKII